MQYTWKSISSQCCLSKLLLKMWMWQHCAYTCGSLVLFLKMVLPVKIHGRRLVLHVFRASRLTCTILSPANCAVLSLLHVSAETQQPSSGRYTYIQCVYSWWVHRISDVVFALYRGTWYKSCMTRCFNTGWGHPDVLYYKIHNICSYSQSQHASAKVAVRSDIHTKESTQSERHVEFLNVKPGGT